MRAEPSGRLLVKLALALCAVVGSGCAGLPRIDPSGERCFIWPNQQPANVVQIAGTPLAGNATAAPVLTDPIFPQPAVIAPPPVVPGATPVAAAPPPPVPTIPGETMAMTPDHVLAPVGSEVVLRTGICNEGYLVTCEKIDWMIQRGSVGSIVQMGGRGLCNNPILPWNKPKKIDSQLGVGYSAHVPLTIDRGTIDPSDDVQIEPGHAWASITSPVEGTSYVTAVSQAMRDWPQRRANATIYWVDVQWEFPAATISSGGSQVLSTTVRRQSDGLPLPGWVVRYEVAAGTGLLTGGTANQVVEVITGADGRASVDVTPTGGSGSSTQIDVQLVRPPGLNGSDMPRLIIATSTSTINWTGAGNYLPPADDLGGTIPTLPIPGTGGSTEPATPITPTPPPAGISGRPVLELEILGNDTAKIGEEARFEVIIRNQGDTAATGLVLNDRFDEGFSHPNDRLGTRNITKPLSVTIGPGQSHTEFITFNILRAGSLCHDVSIRSAEGAETAKRACVNVAELSIEEQPGMEVRKDGPRQSVVGETTLFTLSVKNTGRIPLTNVLVRDTYDSSLSPRPRTPGAEENRNTGSGPEFIWRIPRLEPGEIKKFEVDATCQAPKTRACSIAYVSVEGGAGLGMVESADDHCIEILESRAPGIGGPADVMPNAAAGTGGLGLSISPYNPKPIAGARATYQFFVQNNAATPDENIQLRVIFPPELVPDMATVQADVDAQLVGNELRFNPVKMIRPNERLSFTVTTSVIRAGIVNVTAQVISTKFPQGVQKTEQVEIVGF
jgi:uncharacterized repeat protein (TIGR01451 family)